LLLYRCFSHCLVFTSSCWSPSWSITEWSFFPIVLTPLPAKQVEQQHERATYDCNATSSYNNRDNRRTTFLEYYYVCCLISFSVWMLLHGVHHTFMRLT
jgi:hypothetical protein